jgi:hypothetical protein
MTDQHQVSESGARGYALGACTADWSHLLATELMSCTVRYIWRRVHFTTFSVAVEGTSPVRCLAADALALEGSWVRGRVEAQALVAVSAPVLVEVLASVLSESGAFSVQS